MSNEIKTRFLTRMSVAALFLAVLAGAFAGGVLVRTNADAQPVDTPQPRRTAYVDFLMLLKNDQPLLAAQSEIQLGVQSEMDKIDAEYIPLINAEVATKRLYKPDTRQYRQAMNKQLELERRRFQEQLLLEQQAQMTLRDQGIERFKALRNLARDIALDLGYNEVLNIVRDVEDIAAAQEDFQSLQQQLLVSPVLYFEPSHDITDVVLEKADEQWGTDISFDSGNVDDPNEIEFTVEGAEAAVERNEDGEIEVRLAQKGKFKIRVFEKGEELGGEDPDAEVVWSKAGVGVGELGEDGSFTASDDWPPRGEDKFVVYVRSVKDPSVTRKVTIKLLSKDGKTRAEVEAEEEDAGDEGEDE